MIKKLEGERWKDAPFPKSLKKNYAVSNMGRVASYTNKLLEDGTLLKGSLQEGYRIMRYNVYTKKGKRYEFVFFHTLVAQAFCKQKSPKHSKVIFKDFNRKNLTADNLKWVTVEEQYAHSIQSPQYLKASKRLRQPVKGPQLDVEKVKKIKQALKAGKTLKSLATKYKVSDMQIHRIKTGENWSHVKA
ncbi:MAG TPA: NUMOD4 domain-containing protein [Lacibacter sp.]|nr:NUMOD4 domain-containing protein [Lacibacter sp.]HMO88402.1 NUMOD4 domain-containing protein [Lacibacter sp.]HMP87293.1 NUMOD4 domain-containing protein [Lacibacter sp.]